VKSTGFYETLELWKGTKIYSVGTVYYSLTKEIGMYTAAIGLFA